MKASHALKKLRQAINIEYYIGKEAAEVIEKACADKPKATPKKESK